MEERPRKADVWQEVPFEKKVSRIGELSARIHHDVQPHSIVYNHLGKLVGMRADTRIKEIEAEAAEMEGQLKQFKVVRNKLLETAHERFKDSLNAHTKMFAELAPYGLFLIPKLIRHYESIGTKLRNLRNSGDVPEDRLPSLNQMIRKHKFMLRGLREYDDALAHFGAMKKVDVQLVPQLRNSRSLMIVDRDQLPFHLRAVANPRIRANPIDIHLLLQNMFANSLKLGARNFRVNVGFKISGGKKYALLRVSDDGPGIERSKLGEVFKPFVKGERSTGSGLGLYTVSRIVKDHKGMVSVRNNTPGNEPKEGRGVTFEILIPAITRKKIGGA